MIVHRTYREVQCEKYFIANSKTHHQFCVRYWEVSVVSTIFQVIYPFHLILYLVTKGALFTNFILETDQNYFQSYLSTSAITCGLSTVNLNSLQDYAACTLATDQSLTHILGEALHVVSERLRYWLLVDSKMWRGLLKTIALFCT